jgi:hypothetical protein
MKKNASTNPEKLHLLMGLIAVVAFIQVGLIFAKILPPISANSIGNQIFQLATVGLLAYAGFAYSKDGIKSAAFAGAKLGFISALIILFGAVISKMFFNLPLLGISFPDYFSFALILLAMLVANTVLGMAISCITAFIASKVS